MDTCTTINVSKIVTPASLVTPNKSYVSVYLSHNFCVVNEDDFMEYQMMMDEHKMEESQETV